MLVTAAEHYGAVMNLDFDYIPYLDTLQARGANLTRIFSGAYVERAGDIAWMGDNNTLAPRPNRLIVPWARSSSQSYANGGNKFNLDVWDASYFHRLKDFISEASQRGILVEVVMFSQMYADSQWGVSPLNISNNVNGVGNISWDQFLTTWDAGLLARQEAMVAKIVSELHTFDNVYYEICNEPNTVDGEGGSHDWHVRIVQKIYDTESALGARHMIAVNYPDDPIIDDWRVAIVNSHYTWGDSWTGGIEMLDGYYGKNKVLALDETLGPLYDASASDVRVEAWEMLIGGGAVYNCLSWEFTSDNPSGTVANNLILDQLKVLKNYYHGWNFLKMSPHKEIVTSGVPGGAQMRALVELGQQYIVYLHHGRRDLDTRYTVSPGSHQANLSVDLPAANYRIEWINPADGNALSGQDIAHGGGNRTFSSPQYSEDILLQILRIMGDGP
ncbi:MAG TPA: hypothetical protein VM842_05365 [Nitrospira sp.]|nr:hypothetical protein [Nitrospira sp.]